MRDQYAGGVSDVLKFAFLRALAGTDRTLGTVWYYTPGDDGRADGRHLEWRNEPAWQRLDAQFNAGLSMLPERSVAALESTPIWPRGSVFHREPMPSRILRNAWAMRKRAALDGADIIFLDPDNGLGAETAKHATFSEIWLLRRPGRTTVFITFPGRSLPYDALAQRLHERMSIEADAGAVVTLRTNVSVPRTEESRSYVQRQRWFTVVDPDAELIARARTDVRRRSRIRSACPGAVAQHGMSASEAIRSLAREVLSVAEIARRLGVPYQHAYNVLKDGGMPPTTHSTAKALFLADYGAWYLITLGTIAIIVMLLALGFGA